MKRFKKIISALLSLVIMTGAAVPVYFNESSIMSVSAAEASADDIAPLISEFRTHLLGRENNFSIAVPYDQLSAETLSAMISGALEDTGKGNEGDYLRWNIDRYSYRTGSRYSDGYYMDFTVDYNTTADQEKQTDAAVAAILSSLDTGSGSDYDKILAAYDYVAKNVDYPKSYTSSNRSIYTAYGAAVNRSAVCEGYAMLLYRLLRELGISCRALPGTANGGAHMWNMAEIGGKYYLMDCTFDSNLGGTHYYFLRGSSDFDDYNPEYTHVFGLQQTGNPLLTELESEDFFKQYPIAEYKYDPLSAPPVTAPEYILGDVNSNSAVDADDASAVLRCYAQFSTTGKSDFTEAQLVIADVNKDGAVNAGDASAILAYYAYASSGKNIDSPEEYFNTMFSQK